MNLLDVDLLEKETDRRYTREKDAFREVRRILGEKSLSGEGDSGGKPKPKFATIERQVEPAQSPETQPARNGTKTAKIFGLLGRPGGVTIEGIIAATKWKLTTVRGHLSALRKRGYPVDSIKRKADGKRAYFLSGS